MNTPRLDSSPAIAALRLGFWSAVLVAVEVATFAAALLLPGGLMLAFLASFFLAPTFVALMVAIHDATPVDKKVWSHLGLAFAIVYAVMGTLTYYVQLAVVRTNSPGLPADLLPAFVFKPGSVVFAQDMLGYAFMCLATLVAAPVFSGSRLSSWIRWLFVVNGLLLVSSLVFPALPMPQDPASAAASDRIGTLVNLAWCALFAPIAILLAVYFRRLRRSLPAADRSPAARPVSW